MPIRQRESESETWNAELLLQLVAMAAATTKLLLPLSFLLLLPSFLPNAAAYRAGDIVPMSRMGQYHSVRSHLPFHSLRFSLPFILRRFISHSFSCIVIAVENRVARPHWPPLPHLRCESRGTEVVDLGFS